MQSRKDFHVFACAHTYLSDLKQEGDPEGAKYFLVEMSDRD